jgi:hypothetical protein
VTGGYGWIRSFPYGEQPIVETFDEHRIWQQLVTKSVTRTVQVGAPLPPGAASHAFSSGSRWQHRARYFVQVTWPCAQPPGVGGHGLRRGLHRASASLDVSNGRICCNKTVCPWPRTDAWAGGTSVQLGYLHQVLMEGRWPKGGAATTLCSWGSGTTWTVRK